MANRQQLALLEESIREGNHCHSWNVWREQQSDIEIDLSGVNFQDVNLSGANLERANLSRGNLSGALFECAKLDYADLFQADLSRTDFSNAKLRAANFFEADLSSAILIGANLHAANFGRANLCDANFKRAILTDSVFVETKCLRTYFIEANLSQATLTSAYIDELHTEGWIIDNVICDYIYSVNNRKSRIPANRKFGRCEFERLYRSFPSFDYYFEKGLHPLAPWAADQIICMIREETGIELEIESFAAVGTHPSMKVRVKSRNDLARVESTFKEHMDLCKGEILNQIRSTRSRELIQIFNGDLVLGEKSMDCENKNSSTRRFVGERASVGINIPASNDNTTMSSGPRKN